MQRVSSRMSYTIEHMYDMYNVNWTLSHYRIRDAGLVNYSMHTMFPSFFRVSLQEDKIELPIFAREFVQGKLLERLEDRLNPMRRRDIIIPFYNAEYNCATYRTADVLIRNLVEFGSSFRSMYLTAKTNKGETYHGCNGTIFNKDMVPLIFNVIECEIVNNALVYKRVKSYIHPSVFYSDGTVEKCIVNKIIPFVMQNGIKIMPHDSRVVDNISYVGTGRVGRTIPELSVSNIADRFFYKPILPSVAYSDDDINDMLNRNIDDVFNIIGL